MLTYAMAIGIVLTGVGAVLAGIAAMKIADAWKIWAGRCHPKNPNFRAPPIYAGRRVRPTSEG
jgi:hypothetical protein